MTQPLVLKSQNTLSLGCLMNSLCKHWLLTPRVWYPTIEHLFLLQRHTSDLLQKHTSARFHLWKLWNAAKTCCFNKTLGKIIMDDSKESWWEESSDALTLVVYTPFSVWKQRPHPSRWTMGTCRKNSWTFFVPSGLREIQNPSKQRWVLISRHITVSTFFAIFSAWYSANWFWTRWTLEKNFVAAVEVHSLYHSLIHLHSAAASWECMAIRMFQPGEKRLSFLHTTNGKFMKTVSTWT